MWPIRAMVVVYLTPTISRTISTSPERYRDFSGSTIANTVVVYLRRSDIFLSFRLYMNHREVSTRSTLLVMCCVCFGDVALSVDVVRRFKWRAVETDGIFQLVVYLFENLLKHEKLSVWYIFANCKRNQQLFLSSFITSVV